MVIGALESASRARRAIGALRSVMRPSDLPEIRALVLTHYSVDTCGGAEVFSGAGVPIVAHQHFAGCQEEALERWVRTRPTAERRADMEGGLRLGERPEEVAAAGGGGIASGFRQKN